MSGSRSPADRAPAVVRWRRQARLGTLAALGFRGRWVATPQGRVRALCRGPARDAAATWLFLHGYADEATGWAPLMWRLARHLGRVVLLDLPGHGISDVPAEGLTPAPLLAGLLAASAEAVSAGEPVVVVGNSMGGAGAVRVAQHLGPRARGIALISPAGAPMTAEEIAAVEARFTLDSPAKALALVQALMPDRRLQWLAARVLRQHLSRPAIAGLMRSFGGFCWLAPADLAALPPALLVWGGNDRVLPDSGHHFFAAHLNAACSRCVAPPAWSHTPQFDVPAALADLLLDWARPIGGLLRPAGR